MLVKCLLFRFNDVVYMHHILYLTCERTCHIGIVPWTLFFIFTTKYLHSSVLVRILWKKHSNHYRVRCPVFLSILFLFHYQPYNNNQYLRCSVPQIAKIELPSATKRRDFIYFLYKLLHECSHRWWENICLQGKIAI